MIMKYRILIIVFLLFFPIFVYAQEIKSIQDQQLNQFISNFVILAEAKYPKSKGMGIRVLRITDFGECDGSPNTCPKSTVYISVTEYGEFPKQSTYQLPKYHDWAFVSWDVLPDQDGRDDYVVLKMKAQIPSSDLNKGWWTDKIFIVKANYNECYFSEE